MKPNKKKVGKATQKAKPKSDLCLKLAKVELLSHPQVHKCSICDGEYPDKTTLVKHFRNEHASKPHQPDESALINCDWCTQQFPNLRKAYVHRSTVHRSEACNFECPHCAKLFGFSFLLEKHMASEHIKHEGGDESYICDFCQSCFSTTDALIVHQKQHETKIPFFVPRSSRRLKLNANSEVTPVYYCPHCASEYILKFNLKRHISEDHQDRIHQPPHATEITTCRICDAVFFNKRAFDAHNTHTVNDIFMPETGLPNLKVDLD